MNPVQPAPNVAVEILRHFGPIKSPIVQREARALAVQTYNYAMQRAGAHTSARAIRRAQARANAMHGGK